MSVELTKKIGAFYADININGLGGHSSVPFKTHNPVIAGFETIHTINTRVWFEFDSFDHVSLLPVEFQAGTKENIIPETAKLKFYGHYGSEEQKAHLKEVLETSLDSIKNLYHVDYELTYEEAV